MGDFAPSDCSRYLDLHTLRRLPHMPQTHIDSDARGTLCPTEWSLVARSNDGAQQESVHTQKCLSAHRHATDRLLSTWLRNLEFHVPLQTPRGRPWGE